MSPLTAADHQRWDRDGFLHLGAFLEPARVEQLRSWVSEVASWPDDEMRWMHHREETPAGPRLSRSENFVPYHDDLRALLTSGPVIDTVGELLGEPAVLYKEKINYKYPGGGGYAAHQDAPAYRFIQNHVTCLLAVDEATAANGCLFFAAGHHRGGLLALDERGCLAPAVADELRWEPVELSPGDALFFSSYAPHHSPTNTTDEPRRALYLTYNAEAEGDHHDAYYQEKREAFADATRRGEPMAGYISKIGHFQGRTVPTT